MNTAEYTIKARRTNADTDPVRLCLEVAAEAGEVAGVAAKAMRKGQAVIDRRSDIVDECGDVLWSVAMLLDSVGSSLSEAMSANIAKLEARHNVRGQS